MKLFLALSLLVVGCGPTDPPGFDPAYAKVAPIVQRDCGTCHNGSYQVAFNSAQAFLGSAAKEHLLSGEMPPPPMTISAADKAALLDYLK